MLKEKRRVYSEHCIGCNKTLVVIAHKFNSIENANQVLVLDKGKIREKGTHDSLIENNGSCSKLWKAQQLAGGWKIR